MPSRTATQVDMSATSPDITRQRPTPKKIQYGGRKTGSSYIYISSKDIFAIPKSRIMFTCTVSHSREHVSDTIQQSPTPYKSNMAAKNTEITSFWPPYWIFWCGTLSDAVAHLSTGMAMCENIYLAFEIFKKP